MIANVYFFDEVQAMIVIVGISSSAKSTDLLICNIVTFNKRM